METKIRQYMDELFHEVPVNRQSVEVKEEILQNITDKYHDLLKEGKSEEAAYNIAIASIGDLTELLESLKGTDTPEENSIIFQYNEWKKHSALRVSIAVALYIFSVIPPIIVDMAGVNENIGAIGLCVIAAIATAILVYNYSSKPITPSDTQNVNNSMADNLKSQQESKSIQRKAMKDITKAIWAVTLVLYFVISFSTMAWHITWVLFLMAVALRYVISAIFTLREGKE